MPRAILACLLVLLLTVGASPVWGADLTVRQQAARLKAGRKVIVTLMNGDFVKGKMGAVAADQFTVTSAGGTRTILFTEAQSVKTDGLTVRQKWAIAVGVWLGLSILGALV